jgi:phosphoribosyl-AMP cyclohydrolase
MMITLDFNKSAEGLLPAIVQDHKTLEVLMVAYINAASWEMTLKTGKAHYWSRSRNQLWLKGETSGHVQIIHDILVDCDDDTVIFQVEQVGNAACHTGHRSCFYRRVSGDTLVEVGGKIFDPAAVYGDK